MADSSGNMKLLVGVVLGAVVSAIVVFFTTPKASAPAPAKPAKAAVVKEVQAPLVAPAPTPATRTGDWRGQVEVGESAPPQPQAVAVPSSRSDIRAMVKTIAQQVGGRDKIAAIQEATWTLSVKQGQRRVTRVVELVGARGLRITDTMQGLVAVWRRDGTCKERRGAVEAPCQPQLERFAETVYGAHIGHVMALLGKRFVRPIRVKSGMGDNVPWTLLTFKIRKSPLRLVLGVDTRSLKARASLTTAKQGDKDAKELDTSADESAKDEKADTKVEFFPGLALRTALAATTWKPFHGGVKLPSRFCRTVKSSVTTLVDSEGSPDESCDLEMQLVSVSPGVSKGALRLGRGGSLRVSQGAHHIFIRADVTDQTLAQVVDKLRKDLPKEEFVRNGTFFAVNEGKVQLCEEMAARGANTHELAARPRVVMNSVTVKLDGLPKAFEELEVKAKAAGYQPVAGPRLARPDTRQMPVPGKPLKMLIELPIAP